MRCPQCHKDSITLIINNNNIVVVICSNCENEFEATDSPLLEVLLYNYNVDKIRGEGKLAFLDGKLIDDCPYSDDYRTLWGKGWESEKEDMGESSKLLSAKKESEESGELQEEKIASLTRQLENARGILTDQEEELAEMHRIRNETIVALSSLQNTSYWTGGIYRKEIGTILGVDCERFIKIPIL